MLRVCPRLCRAITNNIEVRANLSSSQTLNTIIVKRVHKPPLIGDKPFKTPQKHLDEAVAHTDDDKWMLYEVVEKHQAHHKVKMILLRNVDDYGKKGQVVEVEWLSAHKHLLLPGFAVHHTEENCDKYRDILIPEGVEVWSSPSAQTFVNFFSKRVFDVSMNISNQWVIEPWHIRATLRRHKVWCKEEDIEIPGGRIEGPDPGLEGKEFVALLTVNNKEKLHLRCRIHHVGEGQQLTKAWYLRPAEPVWEEERQTLLDMNKAPPNKNMREVKEYHGLIQHYDKWKAEREERLA